jgi:hypothetical protein
MEKIPARAAYESVCAGQSDDVWGVAGLLPQAQTLLMTLKIKPMRLLSIKTHNFNLYRINGVIRGILDVLLRE